VHPFTTRPWLPPAVLCPVVYLLVAWLGEGRYRGEFLGLSLAVGAAGAALLVFNRLATRRFWMHWSGVFCLNWLFAAYVVAALAV
jgi:hypothetical protein